MVKSMYVTPKVRWKEICYVKPVLKVLSAYSHKTPKVVAQLIDCVGSRTEVDVFLVGDVWVLAAVELKRRVTHVGDFRIVAGKLGHW